MRLIIVLIVAFSINAYSNEVAIPHYSIFTAGQFKCSDSGWKNFPWDKRYRDIWQLAYKSISIVGNIETVEGPRKNIKKIQGRYRNFDSKYVAYSRILCGEKAEVENNGKGALLTENTIIEEAFERKGYLDLVSDDEPYAKDYLNYSQTPFGEDDPTLNKKGLEGFSCLVRIDDFIKKPLGSINLKRLCKGENRAKQEFTKKEIMRIASILKEAQTTQATTNTNNK